MRDCVYVLDHGYLALVESWGSDEAIIEAARMSTAKGFLGWGPRCVKCGHTYDTVTGHCDLIQCDGGGAVPGDEKLLRFLHENRHSTPFEMAGLTIEVQAPIFVFREWHRHRTQSYSEMSARYTPLPDVNYIPTTDRLMFNSSGANKQAGAVKGAAELTVERAHRFQDRLADVYAHDELMYQEALADGVPKELARVHLPVGRYSRMRASANLRNWLAFLTLRMAPGAQWEIRQYANAIGALVERVFPRTWELFAK
jgi:thymidylate synthase (FAD)